MVESDDGSNSCITQQSGGGGSTIETALTRKRNELVKTGRRSSVVFVCWFFVVSFSFLFSSPLWRSVLERQSGERFLVADVFLGHGARFDAPQPRRAVRRSCAPATFRKKRIKLRSSTGPGLFCNWNKNGTCDGVLRIGAEGDVPDPALAVALELRMEREVRRLPQFHRLVGRRGGQKLGVGTATIIQRHPARYYSTKPTLTLLNDGNGIMNNNKRNLGLDWKILYKSIQWNSFCSRVRK